MKTSNNKKRKDTIINFRASSEQKQKIQSDALTLGMTVAEYLLYLAEHKNIVVVPDGKKLAEAIYDLNMVLHHYEKYPFLPVHEIQEAVSQSIESINRVMKEGISNVDIEN